MENKYYLLTPRVDFLLIGGLGLLAYFIILIFFNIFGLNLSWQIKLSYWMIILAFFVNSPHFLISYLIFYRENSDKLFKLNRYALVGLYIPIFLFFFTLVGLIKLDDFYFKSLLFLMFFLVGWHYIKQAYGCFIVYSAGNKIYYSKFEQNIIKISLYPLWVFSFFKNFTYESMRDYWGFQYKFPNFLKEFEFLIGYFSIIGVVSLILLFVYNVFFQNKKINLVALTSLIVIFLWLSPLLSNPYFYLVIPFFHSLQYFLFSGAYTKSKISKNANKRYEFLRWWGVAFILGALLFEFIPDYLDANFLINNNLTPHLFLISFIFFINIHHYFIDSVIWKAGNKDIRDNLNFITR